MDGLIVFLITLGVIVAIVVTVAVALLIKGEFDETPPPVTSAKTATPQPSPKQKQSAPPHRTASTPPAPKAASVKPIKATKAVSPKTARSNPGKSAAAAPSPEQSPPVAIPGPTTRSQRVPNAAQTKGPPSSARNPVPQGTSSWRGLPVGGKVAVCAIPVVALVGIILAVIGFGSRNDGSHAPDHADDRDGLFVESLKRNQRIAIDEDAAVDMARTACNAPTAGVGLYNAQQAMQQRYPQYDPNTVAMVMAQGVLAYCPGRLP